MAGQSAESVENMSDLRQQTALNYPDTWHPETVDMYEHLYTLGKVDQREIDRITKRLADFRWWQAYFAATGGVDEIKRDNLELEDTA
jgi:hypothetical protein